MKVLDTVEETSNCTNMELKLKSASHASLNVLSSNCTNMELKLRSLRFGNIKLLLLIAPIWN